MGQARRRQEALRGGPCVFCGGERAATTVEHCPPKVMFRGKDRPKGFEFSACGDCNSSTSQSDQVAAAIARTLAIAIADDPTGETWRLLEGVRNNVPGLLEELPVKSMGEQVRILRQLGFNYSDYRVAKLGPIARRHLATFAAKLALGVFFDVAGKIAPSTTIVETTILTNAILWSDRIPQDLYKLLSRPVTLSQGKKHVSDQFATAWAGTPDHSLMVVYSEFHRSLAFASFISVSGQSGMEPEAAKVARYIPSWPGKWPE